MSGELTPPSAARDTIRSITSILRCHRGAVAFEFILVAPTLLFILFAILYFGIALNQQLILTTAAEQAAQVLALGRGTATPYTTATNAAQSSAVNLTTAKITQTVKIGGSACSSDSACTPLLTSGAAASVALTYPCELTFMGASFGGSPCTLSAQSAATVQ
jgi:Flp pilus assembly protein TadG